MQIRLLLMILLTCILAACQSKYMKLYKSEPAFYSYIFGNVDDDKIIAQHNPEVSTNVASCQKVITALLAYKVLGPEYIYETKLYTSSQNGKIHHVIIKFSGDASLTTNDIIALLEPIKNKKIAGNIILDASAFQTPDHSPYLMFSDIGSSYAQGVSAMIIDRNLITIIAKPTQNNSLADISIDHDYRFKSDAITNQDISLIIAEWQENNQIYVSGNINIATNDIIRRLSPKSSDQYILQKMTKILKHLNIKGNLKINRDKIESKMQLQQLNIHTSKPLKDIIPSAMKQSNNLVFDSIYLTIVSNINGGAIKKWSQGYTIISQLIEQHLSVNAKNIFMVDGSGLSRYNHVPASALFSILKKNYHNNDLIHCLPAPCEQGSTLALRSILNKDIRAKTGNMKAITCLCGYKLLKRPQVFVITASDFTRSRATMHKIIDEFINQQN